MIDPKHAIKKSNNVFLIVSDPDREMHEVRKEFNGPNHAAVYAKLEAYLGEEFCVYEDGTVYAVAKRIAGVS